MKKKAVIIATPNCPGHDKLPGATKDAEAWKAFLYSPEGGAWEENEVNILSDWKPPTIYLQLEILKTLGLDYALLAFSGQACSRQFC